MRQPISILPFTVYAEQATAQSISLVSSQTTVLKDGHATATLHG